MIAIKRRAAELGFAATGVARLDRNPHAAELDRWLADGHAGTMTYLQRQAEKTERSALDHARGQNGGRDAHQLFPWGQGSEPRGHAAGPSGSIRVVSRLPRRPR